MNINRIVSLMVSMLAIVTVAFGQSSGNQPEAYPKALGYVSDFAGVLSRDQIEQLNGELVALEKSTSVEVAVVTVDSLHGRDVKDYAVDLATAWGVGKKGKDNGVMFLIAPTEHKMRIQTASGARSVLTDSQADEIRDDVIIPKFKTADMAGGIVNGTRAIVAVFDHHDDPAPTQATPPQETPPHANPSEDGDADILASGLLGITTAIIAMVLIGTGWVVIPRLIANSSKKVLERVKRLAGQFAKTEKNAEDLAVTKETRKKLVDLRKKFDIIDNKGVRPQGVRWSKIAEAARGIEEELASLDGKIAREIAYAKKAQKEGPKLLKNLPAMIQEAEDKTGKGKVSKEVQLQLEKARREYDSARKLAATDNNNVAGLSILQWVLIYQFLEASHSNCVSAVSDHQYENTEHTSSDYSSFSSSSSDSFGGGSGFGGSDGGGSSGSW